jgi:hypothetical protein
MHKITDMFCPYVLANHPDGDLPDHDVSSEQHHLWPSIRTHRKIPLNPPYAVN